MNPEYIVIWVEKEYQMEMEAKYKKFTDYREAYEHMEVVQNREGICTDIEVIMVHGKVLLPNRFLEDINREIERCGESL